MFAFLSIRLCPECREHEENCLRRAREILMKQPQLSIIELAEALDEPLEIVEKFLRERRLALKKRDGLNLSCELCGKPIEEGKRCQQCEIRMQKIAQKIAEERKKSSKDKMHSLATIRKREESDS
jgi:hypothetical protein